MSLLQLGNVRLAGGGDSCYKLDCDFLTDADIECCAALLQRLCTPYGSVSGVPRGGERLATAMRPGASMGPLLITEDVVTSGGSVMRHLDKLASAGVDITDAKVAAIFKRGSSARIDGIVNALFYVDVRLIYA